MSFFRLDFSTFHAKILDKSKMQETRMCITIPCEPQDAIFTVGSFLTCLVLLRHRLIPVTVEWQRRREVA